MPHRMFFMSKSPRLSHIKPALQGTGVTVIVRCCRTGLVAKLRPVVGVRRNTLTTRFKVSSLVVVSRRKFRFLTGGDRFHDTLDKDRHGVKAVTEIHRNLVEASACRTYGRDC